MADRSPSPIRIELLDLDDPVARCLENRLFDDLRERYAGEDLDFVPGLAADYRPREGAFLVAWDASEPVGAGALRYIGEGVGELKRLWVDPAHRRRGIARLLTVAREDLARRWGWTHFVLETGWAQPEQKAHAASNGYYPVDRWNTEFDYDPRVTYVGKSL